MYMKPSSRTICMMRKSPAKTLAICRAHPLSRCWVAETQSQLNITKAG